MKFRLIRAAALLSAALVMALSAAQPLLAADLSGKWIFSFSTPEGVVDGTLVLAQDGEKLTAKFDESNLEGSATDERFTLEGDYFAPNAGYSAALTISGKPDGEGLSGEATWDVYDLPFEAKRAD
ncbi:MAG: hypothetical protein O3A53_05190 [Acidobacteria bacterium]|nr:hypothetical protein [Acidobacteriota bacterium]MDA1234175.1 hypothetical protein [Acidobacteriota bacterium]